MAGGRALAGVASGAGSGAGLELVAVAGTSALFLGPEGRALLAAREVLDRVRLPLLIAAGVALAVVAVVIVLRRRRGRAARVLIEGACPACLVLGLSRAAPEPLARRTRTPRCGGPNREGSRSGSARSPVVHRAQLPEPAVPGPVPGPAVPGPRGRGPGSRGAWAAGA